MSPQDYLGRPVTEAEVAANLGFADVHELRCWETELGRKVADLEHRLRTALDERDRFRWHGLRMQAVLERAVPLLEGSDHPLAADLRLAIGVVTGKAADWDHRLEGWFPKPEGKEG